MPERQLVPHSDKRSQRTSSLANRFQSIAPSQRIGLFNSERIRCAYRAATTATNYDGKTLVVNGTGNGGTSDLARDRRPRTGSLEANGETGKISNSVSRRLEGSTGLCFASPPDGVTLEELKNSSNSQAGSAIAFVGSCPRVPQTRLRPAIVPTRRRTCVPSAGTMTSRERPCRADLVASKNQLAPGRKQMLRSK